MKVTPSVLAGEGALSPARLSGHFCLDEEKLAQWLNFNSSNSKWFLSLSLHFCSFVANCLLPFGILSGETV